MKTCTHYPQKKDIGKHRYVHFIGPNKKEIALYRALLQHPVKPYPKRSQYPEYFPEGEDTSKKPCAIKINKEEDQRYLDRWFI